MGCTCPLRPRLSVVRRTRGLDGIQSNRLALGVRQSLAARDARRLEMIARDLGITIPTVRTHVGRLFRKLGLNDRKGLIRHVFVCLRRHGETPALSTGDQSP